jgi:U4/U6 small nuclear ribonucleoprotein PRP3
LAAADYKTCCKAMASESSNKIYDEGSEKKRKRRWGVANPILPTPTAAAALNNDPKAKVLAMQESIKARLAAAKANSLNKRPGDDLAQNQSKKAKHFELDLTQTAPTFKQQTVTATTYSVATPPATAKQNFKINPYLAHTQQDETAAEGTATTLDDHTGAADDSSNFDKLLQPRAEKKRQRHKEIKFVQAGHWQHVAEHKRQLALKHAASGYVSGRKQGHTIHAVNMGDIYTSAGGSSSSILDDSLSPRADAHPDTNCPLLIEWWDVELLPAKLKKQVATEEAKLLQKQSKAALAKLAPEDETFVNTDTKEQSSNDLTSLQNQCVEQAALTYSKTAALVQHIVPIEPPTHINNSNTKQPVLHLTKKERKRQRKMRRQEKQRELQDLQAAGLAPAPEPRLTLKNFIQVLGDQAFLDPSQVEQKVNEQMAARQRAHLDRNLANKILAQEQRAVKRQLALQHDATASSSGAAVCVAVFFVKDMSHPYHRSKVDLNAQQNSITGGVLECENPKLACVICEGDAKAVKRYRRLMEVRMKWTGFEHEDDESDASSMIDDDQDEFAGTKHKFNAENKCVLVWQGMAVKRVFKGFVFQSCETADQARRILKAKGVEHYWDQVLEHMRSERGNSLQLRLGDDSDDEGNENPYAVKDEDVVMRDE